MPQQFKNPTTAAKFKTLIIIPLLCAFAVCAPNYNYAQSARTTPAHVLAFGITDTAKKVVTYNQVMANLTLKCLEPNSEVTSFTFSFLPMEPKGNYYGPFEIRGATISGMALKALASFQAEKTLKLKVFIDEIKTKSDGVAAISNPVFITVTR